jgi:hypothetical protein
MQFHVIVFNRYRMLNRMEWDFNDCMEIHAILGAWNIMRYRMAISAWNSMWCRILYRMEYHAVSHVISHGISCCIACYSAWNIMLHRMLYHM